jgi:DNA-binding MarR family transcriptional regulator
MSLDPHVTAADLRLAVGRLVREMRRETTGLPPRQAAVLGHLDRSGPLTVADLAAAERVSHQAMTRLVAALADAGLVGPVPRGTAAADLDRRRKPLALSAAGRRALEAQRAHRSSRLAAAITAELTDEEHRALARAIGLLDRLAQH